MQFEIQYLGETVEMLVGRQASCHALAVSSAHRLAW